MKIGIVGAMQEEVNLLKNDLTDFSEELVGKRQYLIGKLYGKEVVTVFSRWGKVASASTVTTLIDKFGVSMIIFTGVAGAASPELEIGDVVIADNLLQHDLDASVLPMFKKFEVPLLGVSYFAVQKSYVDLAKTAANDYLKHELFSEVDKQVLTEFKIAVPKVVTGTIASGDQFIADDEIIKELAHSIDNLKCVEMEGAAVAQVCYEHDIPYIVCRSISDKADHSAVIDFPKFVQLVASHFSRGIVRNLLHKL